MEKLGVYIVIVLFVLEQGPKIYKKCSFQFRLMFLDEARR